MKIDPKFLKSFEDYIETYRVSSPDYIEPLHHYLIHGLHPGGMFTSILANDVLLAVQRSHPANDWNQLAGICKWIGHNAPRESYGSYEAIERWCKLDSDSRQRACERAGIQTTVWDILKD